MKAGWELGAALTLVCAAPVSAVRCLTSKMTGDTASMLQVGSIGINLGTVSATGRLPCSMGQSIVIHAVQNCMKLGYMSREALELGSDNSIWCAKVSEVLLQPCSCS